LNKKLFDYSKLIGKDENGEQPLSNESVKKCNNKVFNDQ